MIQFFQYLFARLGYLINLVVADVYLADILRQLGGDQIDNHYNAYDQRDQSYAVTAVPGSPILKCLFYLF